MFGKFIINIYKKAITIVINFKKTSKKIVDFLYDGVIIIMSLNTFLGACAICIFI